MAQVKNISNGPRGAYLDGVLHIAQIGQVIEADDYPEEWFEEVDAKPKGKQAAKPDAAE